jgi:AcrR family transcriptional regulator
MPATRRTHRRADALSRERIVDAGVELLDVDGEGGLTFRRLAHLLRTGPGAIYHHVANKSELLTAATDAVLATAITAGAADGAPEDTVRTIALAVFDAIDAHPWVGAQLANPRQPAMLRIFEGIGRAVQTLGVPDAAGFTSASALTNYIIGTGGNAANARIAGRGTTRADHLATVSVEWANLDRDEFPFTRNVAEQMRDHDDRAQFLDGIDLILTGIRRLGRPPSN